jgi:NAD(P)-dependent dehydrogenase (short-subunit alcohol dehydrogenase family)
MAEEGYDIAISYGDNKDGALKTQRDIQALGRKCWIYQASLHEPKVAEHLVAAVLADTGRIDLLVNNAGLTRHHSILLIKEEEMDFLFNLNYKAYILATGAVARQMVLKGIKGSIVFITSSRAERAYPSDLLYGGLKAALKRSCESIAMELSAFGIRVNCVAPGWTAVREDSAQRLNDAALRIPAGRLGTARENGHVVAFLASEKAAYITGITVRVDGGLILPGMPETDYDNPLRMGWGKPIVDEKFMESVKAR